MQIFSLSLAVAGADFPNKSGPGGCLASTERVLGGAPYNLEALI